ncbi:putative Ig domain-containing protein [Cellvibrio sp. UBA7671]|uniref:putative Ig domain-containing protein n=1 Tax=Cellvibrio sp. UBA7671 TaxID=1946312 RepID=UPI002F35610F
MTTQRRRRPLIEPLESRLLFSATGDIAVLDDSDSDVTYLLNAAENVDLVAIYGNQLALSAIDLPVADGGSQHLQLNDHSNFREVVFIDPSVENFQLLLDDILLNTDSNKVDVVLLGPDGDGLAQINSTLLHYSNLSAVHLITHGKDGSINLGRTIIDSDNLQTYKDELLSWRNVLQDNADILIYGCSVAGSENGLKFIERLSELTQADVAASNDLTGHKTYGGDWELEVHHGDIESQVIVHEIVQEQWMGVLANVDHIFVDTGAYELGISTFVHIGQSFTYDSSGATYGVNSVSLSLKKDVGAPEQTITVELRSSWNGAILGSATLSSSQLSSAQFEFKTFSFSNVDLNDNQTYVIRVSSTDSGGTVKASYHQSNQYVNTSAYIQSGTPNASGWDLAFKVSGDNGINTSPVISNQIPNQGASEDNNFNFQFAANTFADADVGDTLTYTVQLAGGGALPGWLSFDAATRTFSGTPLNAHVGTVSIDVIADDGNGGTVTDTFDIVVANTNDAPTVANVIPNQNATEDAAFNFQFAANTFADVDPAAALTYSAQLAGGGALPAWLSFDPVTRTFSGTPSNGDVGTLTVDVIANDGNGGTVTDTFDIAVSAVNDAPVNTVPGAQITGKNVPITFSAGNSNQIQVADIDAGAATNIEVTLSVSNGVLTLAQTTNLTMVTGDGTADSTLVFTGSITDINSALSTLTYTPANNYTGGDSLSITTKDQGNTGTGGNLMDQDLIGITINNNQAPTVSNAIPNQNATEDAAFNFQFAANTFADADVGDTLTYAAQLAGGGALPAWLSFDSVTRTFSGTPTNAFVGTVSIDVIADDGSGGTVTDTFDIVVANTNDAPTIANAIPNQNATEDAAFNFQFAANTFADADPAAALTYSAQLAGGGALPAWLSFDPVTRTFSGTPTNAFVGTVSIDVIADDGNGGTVTDTFDIVVANSNDAPTIANAIANQNATEDAAFNFQFALNTFADVDVSDTLTYTAQLAGGGAIPAWLSFDPVTRTFSGTPLNANVGTVSIDVIADDGNGGTVTDTFDIVVANTNDAPTIANAISNQNATEDAAFSFQFAANTFADVDPAAALTYSAQLAGGGALPAWLSFDPVTRTFSGTPTNAFVGTVSIDVIANDGNGGTVTDTFDIVVANTNDAPTIANAIPNQNATEDAAFNFQFAANTFADVDPAATLTYSAQLAGGGTLPAWLSFDPVTRTFSGTPANGDVGNVAIDVIADDGNGGTVTDTFDIVVANTNDAPTIANAIPNQNATEDSAFNFQFAANTFADADPAAALTYSAQLAGGGALPAWLGFDPVTRTFSGTPANGDVGTVAIDVIADDGNGGTVTDTFDIVVANTNDAPTIANAISNQNATEDAAFNFQFAANVFADSDVGDTLTYTSQLAGGGALPAWLSFDPVTRTFSGTPTNVFVGTVSIDVIADDGNGGTVTDTFDIVVANSNDAPTVANVIPNQNATEDAAFNFQFAANTFADTDVGDTFTYTSQLAGGGALPAWLSFDAVTRTFSGTPTNAFVGTVSIDVIADDGNGGTVTDTFDIVVANTNDAPTIANAIPNQNTTEDAAFNFQFAANTFADVDPAAALTYSAQLAGGGALPAWLSFDPVTRTFSGTPLNAHVGTVSIDVIADDGNGGTVTDTFDIVVTNTNDAPTVANAIPDRNATENSSFNFQFAANTFADVDVGATLTYTAQLAGGGALPAWLSFDAVTRTFSGTPSNADIGTVSIDVIADDGNGGTVTDTFDLVVSAGINNLPTVANAIPNQNATEDVAFNFQFAANTFNDVDVGNILTYTAQLAGGASLPTWLSFDSATRTFSGLPLNANVGTISVEVIADDGNGGTVTDTFNIVVGNANDAPTIANAIANQNATEDVAFNFQFAANVFADFDVGDTLVYTAQLAGGGALPAWLSFDPVTRTFSGTPLNANVGTVSIDVIADDGNGGTVTDTFDIVVANSNDAPTIANAIANQNATEDAAFNFQFAANVFADSDVGDTLTYAAQLAGGGALPAWLSFDPVTRTFSGTPLNANVGTVSIDVIANDGNGGTVTDTFDIVVANSNDAPTVANAIANQNASENVAFNFQFAANVFADSDVGDTLTYTVQLAGGGAIPAWLSFDPVTRTFSGTPLNVNVGTVSIDVIADDGNGGTVTDTFNIVVGNANDAPTIANAIVNQNATEDAAFNFQFAANVFADSDVGDTLTYTAQLAGGGAIPTWLSFDPVTRTFSGTPLNANVGTVSIDVIADDGNGGTVTDTFDIVVANSNDAPTVANAIANQNASENVAFNFQFAANVFADIDVGDTLTYSAQLAGGGALPAWLSFDPVTRTFSGTPANSDLGTVSIDVIADDGNGGTVTDTFNIVVNVVNNTPTIANTIPDQNATEDAAFNFQFAANTFADVDAGNTLTYSAQLAGGGSLPAWLSFDAVTRTFSGTPLNANVGTVSIDVIADDGNGGTVTDTFSIVIANTNDAPTLANPIADQNAIENSAFNFQFAANTFNDQDVGNVLTYSAQLAGGGALPVWLSFDSATRTFSGTPSSANIDSVLIEVIANDGNGGTISDTFGIVVTNQPVNAPPVLQNTIADQTASEDSPFGFTVAANTFVDAEGDTLNYSAQLSGGGALPSWLRFDAATRTFSGTPTNDDIGNISVLVSVSDGNGGTASDTFIIAVNNTNDAPVLVNPPANQSAQEDIPFSVSFGSNMFADVDADTTLIYSAQLANGDALPDWLVFDATTLSFSGTPTNNDTGTLSIQIIASDGLVSINAQFQLTVIPVNDAPVISGLSPINNVEDAAGDTVDLFVAFSDAETAANQLQYSVVSNSNPTLVSGATIDATTGKLQLSYGANQFGSADLVIRAQDAQGASVETSLRINIESVNDTPVSTGIADLRVAAGAAPQQMNLHNVFSDIEDAAQLKYSLMANSNPAVATNVQIDPVTEMMTLTFSSSTGGESIITLRALDTDNAWVETQFKVTVTAAIAPPIVVPPVTPEDPGTLPPAIPPTVPPITPPTEPPTVEIPVTNPPVDGGAQVIDPLSPPNSDGTTNTNVPGTGGSGNTIINNSDGSDFTYVNDSSSRDYARALELMNYGNVSINLLTASTSLVSLISPDSGFAPWEAEDFDNEVRRLRAQMDETLEEEQHRKAVIAGITFSVTTGLLVWSLRASSLLLTLMSMLPLWRDFDPLPILDNMDKRKKELEQQRKDRIEEDRHIREVGYLFDQGKKKSD